MDSKLLKLTVLLMGFLVFSGIVSAQNEVGLTFGLSTWFSNCDIPSGGQDTDLQPTFGGFFVVKYWNLQLSGSFYSGTFDVHPVDGVTRTDQTVRFTDNEAHRRGFTSNGVTKRTDLDLNLRYVFSRYARISLGLVMNRHEGDVNTYWLPIFDENDGHLILPSDRQAPLIYEDTQFWLSQGFHGSVPVEIISGSFLIFYNIATLIILGETGSGTIISPDGKTREDVGARASYSGTFPPEPLKNRTFGSNAGLAFSTGFGFQISDTPALGLFGGYNFKFFGEKETDLIDHSSFQGPYLGLTLDIF